MHSAMVRTAVLLGVCGGLVAQAQSSESGAQLAGEEFSPLASTINTVQNILGQRSGDRIRIAAGGGGSTHTPSAPGPVAPASPGTKDPHAEAFIHNVWVDLDAKRPLINSLTAAVEQRQGGPEDLVRDFLNSEGRGTDRFDCGTALFYGFRHLYCLLRSFVTVNKLVSLSGVPLFRPGGPHQGDLNWRDPYRFGYYNPDFLRWLDQYAIPNGRSDPRFNQITQTVYASYFRSMARALYHSHEILFLSPREFDSFKSRYEIAGRVYRERLARRETIESRFDPGTPVRSLTAISSDYQARLRNQASSENGDFLQESMRWLSDYLATEKNDNWYVANVAGGFWVRRSIDGTAPQIFALLKKVMNTFEPGRY